MVFKRNTAIDAEALSVVSKSKKFEFPEFKVYLHNKEVDLYIEHFFQYHVERNYSDNITDKIMVSFMLPRGYYNEWILKDPDNLEMTIVMKFNDNKQPLVNRYKFIPDIESEDIGGSLGSLDEEDMNKHDLVNVKGQCVSPLLLIFKAIYISGVFRSYNDENKDDKMDIKDFINTQFHKKLKEVKIFGQPLSYKFFFYEPDNKNKYDNIMIRSGTKFITLPLTLQEDMFGVYGGGLNVYFTNLHVFSSEPNLYCFYIYPLFDKSRFDKEDKMPKLVILEPTNPDIAKNDVEAYYKDKLYKIVVTNSDKISKVEREKYNTITGLKVTLSENMIGDYRVDIEKFKSISIDTEKYTNMFQLDQELKNYTNIENVDFDNNMFRHLTRFQKYQTKFFHMHLVNTNPIFIYPGMPLKYTTLVKNKPTDFKGVVQNVSFSYMVQKKVVSTDILIGVRE